MFLQETVQKYTSELINKAADYLVNLWGTETFQIPNYIQAPNMRVIRLPDLPKYPLEAYEVSNV